MREILIRLVIFIVGVIVGIAVASYAPEDWYDAGFRPAPEAGLLGSHWHAAGIVTEGGNGVPSSAAR